MFTYILQGIDAASVDYWSKKIEVLRLEIENFIYPPSFQVFVLGRQATAPSFVNIQFSHNSGNPYDFIVTLLLDLVSSHEG